MASTFSSIWWLPFAILALAAARAVGETGPLALAHMLLLGIGFLVAVFLEVAARVTLARQRLAPGFEASPEAARMILDATARIARGINVVLAVFMALLSLPPGAIPELGHAGLIGVAMTLLACAIVWSVLTLRGVHGHLERTGRLGGLEGWNGFVYRNARDPRIWVPKLSGFGMSLNFAHGRAWLVLCAILAGPLGVLVLTLAGVFRR